MWSEVKKRERLVKKEDKEALEQYNERLEKEYL